MTAEIQQIKVAEKCATAASEQEAFPAAFAAVLMYGHRGASDALQVSDNSSPSF
tara:strand:- start:4548 stop:4709 length:162 start_codon:yes stop_codon:yes gene_type:complete